jgi:uncharacterized protein YyaL (SSP411 family)
VTKKRRYKRVVIKSIKEIDRRFKTDRGLYFSASSADSRGVEGAYFLYRYDNVKLALTRNGFTKEQTEDVLHSFNILEFSILDDGYSHIFFTSSNRAKKSDKALAVLKSIREKKEYPFVDKKIIVSWNAMMIKALFSSGQIDIRYKREALKALDRLLKVSYKKGVLYHQILQNKTTNKVALLEDYAFLIEVLNIAYMRTFDKKYLKISKSLAELAIKKFYRNGLWYLGSSTLNVKSDFKDKHYTSPASIMLNALLSLANITYNIELLRSTKKMISKNKNRILSNISYHPEAIKAIIRADKKDIILKSNRANLIKNFDKIWSIKYPFLLFSEENTELFLACDEMVCFAYDKSLDKVIREMF